MKRGFKRLLSIMLAAVMMLAMGTTVLADGNVTIVTNLSDHTFAAYKVFAGTNASDNTFTVSDWGDGVTSTTLLETLLANETVVVDTTKVKDLFTSSMSAAAVAQVLTTYNTNTVLANAFVEAAYAAKAGTPTTITASSNTTLESGYYLIVDTTTLSTSLTVDAYNNALLQVVGTSVTINQKTDAPSVEKKVEEIGYTEQDSQYVAQYNDVADYSIGDKINYQLIGTIPASTYLAYYSYYKYTFTDTLSVGLTADTNSVKVYLAKDKTSGDSSSNWVLLGSSVTITDPNTVTYTNYTVNLADAAATGTYAGGHVLTVTFSDILTLRDSSGNVIDLSQYSYIIVEYQAELNSSAAIGLNGNPNKVLLTYSSNPNSTSAGDTEDKTENTPEDEVIVFTYELDVTKIDADDNSKIANAQFKLYYIDNTNSNTNTYVKIDSSNKVTGWTTNSSEASILTSDSNGVFKVSGLEDGTYYLEEVSAPTGYVKLSNAITLTIAASTNNGQSWTDGTSSSALTGITLSVTDSSANNTTASNGDNSKGVVSMTVSNKKGTNLPATGGIGTTIFYIVGAILVVGAGVILITRRRMNRD